MKGYGRSDIEAEGYGRSDIEVSGYGWTDIEAEGCESTEEGSWKRARESLPLKATVHV